MARESAAIGAAGQRLGDKVEQVIDLLASVSGKRIFTAVGKMAFVAAKAAATFSSTGSPAFFLHAADATHGDRGAVSAGDVVIALSNSGQTEEVLAWMPWLKQHDIPLISITGDSTSPLAAGSLHVIDIGGLEEADPHGIVPTSTTTVAMAICDALAIALGCRQGFDKEQFAQFHPGGSIGRRLLLKTSALMHCDAAVPVVAPGTRLRDAIVEISRKRLGAVLVVSPDQQLHGILTDGDIRRLLEQHDNPLDVPIDGYMSSEPTTIGENSLAEESLRLMQDREITVLPVLGGGNRIVGVVHMHDLLRVGLR